MPTSRVRISRKHLDEARRAARARSSTSADPLIFADLAFRNLKLRVQGASASWIVKWDGKTRTIGTVDDLSDVDEVRAIASKVVKLLKAGIDPRSYLLDVQVGKRDDDAATLIERANAVRLGRWTWGQLVDHYVDGYLSNPRVNSRGEWREPSLNTAREARRYLSAFEETQHLKDRLLSEITLGDLEDIRNQFFLAGRRTASRQFVAYSKAALSYARRHDARASGLENSPHWWRELTVRQETIPRPKNRYPTLPELCEVLLAAEAVRVVPNRSQQRRTSDIALCGLWWIALSGQRATAALSLEKDHIFPWPEGPVGWKIVYFRPEVMKSRRSFALPIPPRVHMLLERAMSASTRETKYVFPASSLRAGKRDECMSRSAPVQLMQRLRGRPSGKHRNDTRVNLLEGIDPFSPHDIRRTVATTCGELTVRGDAISAMLDHATVSTLDSKQSAAAITVRVYSQSQMLELKRLAVEAWTGELFKMFEATWQKHQPSPLVPPRPALPGAEKRASTTLNRMRVTGSPWFVQAEAAKKMRSDKFRAALERRAVATAANLYQDDDEPYEP